MFSFRMNILQMKLLKYLEKSVCFLFLPLVLNDSCGQHFTSKNVYTLKIIKVNLLFCFAML